MLINSIFYLEEEYLLHRKLICILFYFILGCCYIEQLQGMSVFVA
jgi:hypothetical protein